MGRKRYQKLDIDPSYLRPATRRRLKSSKLNPFYGIPARTIAEWCCVSVGTAEHYKAGRRPPPTGALKLFRLYRDQKVIGTEWEGYRMIGDKMFGPDGRFIPPSHVALMSLLWHALSDADTDKYNELQKIAASLD